MRSLSDRGPNLNNFISQKPQVSLLDGLFTQELPLVDGEPLWPVDTQSHPVVCSKQHESPALRPKF